MVDKYAPKTPRLHHNRAKAIDCPKCNVVAGASCVRVDGKNGCVHRARVLKWERSVIDALVAPELEYKNKGLQGY